MSPTWHSQTPFGEKSRTITYKDTFDPRFYECLLSADDGVPQLCVAKEVLYPGLWAAFGVVLVTYFFWHVLWKK